VTLDLNPAEGWISDEASTNMGAWMGISDWDSWDSSARRGDSGRGIRGLASDAPVTGASGVRFLSRKRAVRHITMSTIWLMDVEQFGIFPSSTRYKKGIGIFDELRMVNGYELVDEGKGVNKRSYLYCYTSRWMS